MLFFLPLIILSILLFYFGSCSKDGDNANSNTSNKAPTAPSNPDPYNTEVQVNSMDLSWSASTDPEGDPITYDVYLGTTINPGKIASDLTSTNFTANLNDWTVYLWKVVAKDNHNHSTSSVIWSFTTRDIYRAPVKPYFMDPSDKATNISQYETLSWTSYYATYYDVYIGTSNPPPSLKTVTNEECAVGPLNKNTKYYWQIYAGNGVSGTFSDIISFTTAP